MRGDSTIKKTKKKSSGVTHLNRILSNEKLVQSEIKAISKKEKSFLHSKLKHLTLVVAANQIFDDVLKKTLEGMSRSQMIGDDGLPKGSKSKSFSVREDLHRSLGHDEEDDDEGIGFVMIDFDPPDKKQKGGFGLRKLANPPRRLKTSCDAPAPLWVPDSLVAQCFCCQKTFSILIRKHRLLSKFYF